MHRGKCESCFEIRWHVGNPEIKIPFPKETQDIESKLRAIGLSSQVDYAVLSINHAAEDAAKNARPIFVSAIRGMNVTDAINGLFVMIAKEEQKIRKDPVARTTELLKKVFGN